jgi:hypothetical protein
MIGSVDVKTRPLRLAYLVDPRNATQIREAIQLSSSLWGGTYFPMLPVYERMPKTWAELPLKRPKPDTVLRGYIEAFDPDVLVQFSTEVPTFITGAGIEIVPPQDIWSVLETGRTLTPRFGLGIFEVLGDIFEKSFRYKAKYPVRVMLPQLTRELPLFWASVFGEIPPALKPILDKRFREPLEIEEPKFTEDKLDHFMTPDILFPRRIAQYGLRHERRAGFR